MIQQASVHASFTPPTPPPHRLPADAVRATLQWVFTCRLAPSSTVTGRLGLYLLSLDQDKSLPALVSLLLLLLCLQPALSDTARANLGKCKPFVNTHSSRVKDQNLQPSLCGPPGPLSSLSPAVALSSLQLPSALGTLCTPCYTRGGLCTPSSAPPPALPASCLNVLQTPARRRTPTLEPTAWSGSAICQPWDRGQRIHSTFLGLTSLVSYNRHCGSNMGQGCREHSG